MEFDFNTMVNKAYQCLEQGSHADLLILPNIIMDIGTTRLHWKNVKDYLRVVRRHPDHFMEFLKHQLPGKEISWYSGSKADGLIVHGKYQKKTEITELAIKYVKEYVTCSSCNKTDTILTKQNSKSYQFECLSCGMKKYTV
jgi:translation initiation factor 2 beta subunit (eIF-2beta)/eIF-5